MLIPVALQHLERKFLKGFSKTVGKPPTAWSCFKIKQNNLYPPVALPPFQCSRSAGDFHQSHSSDVPFTTHMTRSPSLASVVTRRTREQLPLRLVIGSVPRAIKVMSLLPVVRERQCRERSTGYFSILKQFQVVGFFKNLGKPLNIQ